MDKNQIVINTLVFHQELQSGVPQSVMMDWIHQLGLKSIEVRREYIKDFENELSDIKNKSLSYGMNVFYSIPDVLYENHLLKIQDFELYCQEAKEMNCRSIKLNIGNFDRIIKNDLKAITSLSEKYDVVVRVENDQTEDNGRSVKINNFLSLVKKQGGNISFTFDIGNWLFQNEDPVENAKLLYPFVTYIHVKDIDASKKTVLLNEGIIDWKLILSILPDNVPVAIEYPILNKEAIVSEVNKLLVT